MGVDGLLVAIMLLFAFRGDMIPSALGDVARIGLPLPVCSVVMLVGSFLLGRTIGLSHATSATVAFLEAGRGHEQAGCSAATRATQGDEHLDHPRARGTVLRHGRVDHESGTGDQATVCGARGRGEPRPVAPPSPGGTAGRERRRRRHTPRPRTSAAGSGREPSAAPWDLGGGVRARSCGGCRPEPAIVAPCAVSSALKTEESPDRRTFSPPAPVCPSGGHGGRVLGEALRSGQAMHGAPWGCPYSAHSRR